MSERYRDELVDLLMASSTYLGTHDAQSKARARARLRDAMAKAIEALNVPEGDAPPPAVERAQLDGSTDAPSGACPAETVPPAGTPPAKTLPAPLPFITSLPLPASEDNPSLAGGAPAILLAGSEPRHGLLCRECSGPPYTEPKGCWGYCSACGTWQALYLRPWPWSKFDSPSVMQGDRK